MLTDFSALKKSRDEYIVRLNGIYASNLDKVDNVLIFI